MPTEPPASDLDPNPEDRGITASPDNITDTEEDGSEGEVEHVRGNGSAHLDDGEDSEEGDSEDEEDEEDEGEEDTDEEEEDEDEEPALKYERLGGIVSKLLQRDSSSALAYANQRLVSVALGICRHYSVLTYSAAVVGIRYTWRETARSRSLWAAHQIVCCSFGFCPRHIA